VSRRLREEPPAQTGTGGACMPESAQEEGKHEHATQECKHESQQPCGRSEQDRLGLFVWEAHAGRHPGSGRRASKLQGVHCQDKAAGSAVAPDIHHTLSQVGANAQLEPSTLGARRRRLAVVLRDRQEHPADWEAREPGDGTCSLAGIAGEDFD